MVQAAAAARTPVSLYARLASGDHLPLLQVVAVLLRIARNRHHGRWWGVHGSNQCHGCAAGRPCSVFWPAGGSWVPPLSSCTPAVCVSSSSAVAADAEKKQVRPQLQRLHTGRPGQFEQGQWQPPMHRPGAAGQARAARRHAGGKAPRRGGGVAAAAARRGRRSLPLCLRTSVLGSALHLHE
jgi:hypothetical protein